VVTEEKENEWQNALPTNGKYFNVGERNFLTLQVHVSRLENLSLVNEWPEE
jgi:hypothetical protein